MPLLQKPSSCTGCPLYAKGHGFAVPDGKGINRVLIVGDILRSHEAKAGLPFRPYSEDGCVLERAIVSLGYSREQFSFFTLINCQPPANELVGAAYETEAVLHCRRHLDSVVAKFKPTVILAMGAVAIRHLTGMAGKKMTVDLLQGYAVPCAYYPGVRVIPCYHPQYLSRGQWEVYGVFRLCIKKAVELAKAGWKEESLDYREEATLNDLVEMEKRLKAEPERTLACDFETDGEEQDVPDDLLEDVDGVEKEIEEEQGNEDACEVEDEEDEFKPTKTKRITVFQNVTQMNFSDEVRTGLAIEYNHQTKPYIQRVLNTRNEKVGHNWWHFDAGVAAFNGLSVAGPLVHDTIWSFHHLQPDLPGKKSKKSAENSRDKDMGSLAPLQFVASIYGFPFPWKHEFKNKPGWYGCCDVDSDLRAHLGIARDLSQIICDPLTGKTAWDGYLEMVYDMQPILERMGSRGIPVSLEDIRAFTRKMRVKGREIYQEMMDKYVPHEILPSRQKLGLKRAPKDTTNYVKKAFILIEPERCSCVRKTRSDTCLECGGKPKKGKKMVCQDCDRVLPSIATCLLDCPDCKGSGEIHGMVDRWTTLLPFKTSPKQLKTYAAFRGHHIPMNAKRKRAMDKETLERMILKYKDPLYERVIQHREFNKFAVTYGLGWMPHDDGCAHPQFGNTPATGQSSSTSPNAQNRPNPSKMGELASEFGRCIKSKPGFTLVEGDWRSFHALTLGEEAKDYRYMRLARLDIHSYLTAHLVKDEKRNIALSWGDEELADYLKWIKKSFLRVRNLKAKPAILGYGFGLGASTMFGMNRESFNNKDEVQLVIDTLSGEFPECARYRVESPELAHREKKLVTRFGAVRWFWNAKTWDVRARVWAHGKDWEKAIAFRPAANAFGHKKFVMRTLEEQGLLERWGLINDIHDALLFHCPDVLVDECEYELWRAMRIQSPTILMPDGSGFWCDAEIKKGKNWTDMEEVVLCDV